MKRKKMSGLGAILLACVAMLAVLLVSSCSKDKDADPESAGTAYPKTVNIEYRVTSATGLAAANLTYVNETGGMASVEAAALPAVIKVTRKVNQFDALLIGGTSYVGGEMKTEIVVDGKVVESKSFSGTSVIAASTTYVFP